MVPEAELMVSPAGRPVADHDVIDAVDEESLAELAREMAAPEPLVWLPGLVTVTVLVMVQVNEAVPE
jgi:hypothetical protein